jgi:hypothetical protein
MKQILVVLVAGFGATAATPMSTEELLHLAGKSVERFWEQLSAVNCIETVDQQKLSTNGKVVYRQESSFDYLAVLQLTGSDLIVDESRVPMREAEHRKDVALLITNGFSTFEFIFHPFYQGGFEYSRPEAVQVDGKDLLQVKFKHVHGSGSPSVLRLRNRDYPLEWQGTAWIEPQTGSIVRIAAELMSNMEDIGLKALHADVRYARIEFKEDPIAHWLPSIATIEAESVRQHWRNVHTFAKYQLFSVGVSTKTGAAK